MRITEIFADGFMGLEFIDIPSLCVWLGSWFIGGCILLWWSTGSKLSYD